MNTVEQLRAAENVAFTHGYLIATANIMNLHDDSVVAKDVLSQLGETEGVIKRLGLDDYDAKPLRKLFREISRSDKWDRERRAISDAGQSEVQDAL